MKTKLAMIPKSFSQTTRSFPRTICLAFLMPALAQTASAATETFTTVGSTDWTCPPGINSPITIETRGGGGAAGSVAVTGGSAQVRGGGGAGGSFASDVVPVSPGTTYKVIVGAGGLPVTTIPSGTIPTIGEPIQIGGASSFTSFDEVTEFVKAVGGVGGANYAKGSGSTSVNLNGGVASSAGSIGTVIFAGGSGGAPSGMANQGGSGGSGAGSTVVGNAGSGLTGGAAVAGGGAGGSGRGVLNPPEQANGNITNPGNAPGGGGGGAAVSAVNSRFGGPGARGQVKLTYTFASGLDDFDIVVSSPQTAGVPFDVTITAQDAVNVTVNDNTSVVTVTSPAGSLMEFDWNLDGIYGDNFGTLVPSMLDVVPVVGQRTIKARNKKAETKTIVASYYGVSTNTPPSVQTTAAAFAKLQILAPGETSAPGTDTGRTGTPTGQGAGVAFNARVNAVDEFWNLVSTVTDTVIITSTDGVATLPADAALVAGTKLFSVTLNTQGVFTLTATDMTDGTKTAHTTQGITVTNPILVWDAGNTANGVTVDPADGTWNTTAGNLVWNNTGTNIVWEPAKQALFAGADGTYAITVGGSFDAQKIRFENSGYTLSSPSLARTITITIPSGGLTVASGKTATIGTNVSVNGNLTYFIGAADSASTGGTLNIEGTGATVRPAAPGNSLFIQGLGTVVNVKTGGFLGLASGDGNSNFTAGNGASADVSLNVDGGTVNVQSSLSGGSFNVGAEGKATVTLTSGDIIVNPIKTNGVTFGSAASNVSTNTLNLDGGTLTTRTVRKGASPGSTAIFNFNGGALKANTDTTAFMTGLDQANVKSGGALINTVAFNVTIGQNLLDGTGGGGLTKLGSGILTLTGANTYTGPTAVNSGTLALVGGSQTSAFTVASSAKLGFTLGSPTTSTAAVTLTNGTVAITGTVDNVASYKLMTAASFTGPFNLASAISGYQLETRASGTELWLAMVPSDPYLTWAGVGVDFDQDANNDGVKNGLAWLLGAADKDANALGKLPVITQTGGNLKMTFDMLPAAARGTAQLFLEHSVNLGTWSTGVLVPDATGGTAPVTFSVTDSDLLNPNNPLDVEATVSSSEAAAGKLFGRLKAVK